MSNQFDTSFIPQQPLLRVEGVKGRHEPVNFALVLALILFFVVLIIAGGVYFYARSIDARILLRSQELASLEATLDSSKITEYKNIESRIINAKVVLRDHNTFSVVLALLESGAADNIGLTKLAFSNREKKFKVEVHGVGPSYQSIYFQLETWRAISPMVLRVDLSTISVEEATGIVKFSAMIELNSEYLRYMNVYQAIEKARKQDALPEVTGSVSSSGPTGATIDKEVKTPLP